MTDGKPYTPTIDASIAKCLNELIVNDNRKDVLNKVIEILGQGLQAFICGFAENLSYPLSEQNKINIAYCWRLDGQPPKDKSAMGIQPELIPEIKACIANNTVLQASINSNISAELKEILTAFEVEHILVIPVLSTGDFLGLICAGSNEQTFDYDQSIFDALKMLASALGTDMGSREVKKQLFQTNEIYRTTLATLNELIWEYDIRTGDLHVIGFAPKLGVLDEQRMNINMLDWMMEAVHEEDSEEIIKKYKIFLESEENAVFEESYRIYPNQMESVWIHTRQTLLCDLDGKPAMIVGTTADVSENRNVAFELEKHKEQNDFLVQNLNHVFFKANHQGQWTFLNEAWKEITGYSVEESLNKAFAAFIIADQSQELLNEFDMLLKGNIKVWDRQLQLQHKNGYKIWVHVIAKSGKDAQGIIDGVFGSIENIQEKYTADLILRESNDKLNTILNSSKEIILTIDLENEQIENVNSAISILGYTPEEWIGQYYTQWTLDKRRRFYELLKHASESDTKTKSREIFFANKNDETVIPFEFSTSIFYFKNKKYLLCVLRDTRERIAFEKNIIKVTEQLTHLINNIDDVYAIYNLKERKYEFVSDNVEGFFGCSKEMFTEQGLFWEEIMHIEDRAGIVQQMEEVIINKGRGEFFYRINTPIGETKMLLEKITVSVDAEGNADKVYTVKSDYTHIENAEQRMIESERKFRFISENISDFISILDTDGQFLYASPSAEKVIGYTSEELIGTGCIYIIHPDDIQSFIEHALEKAVFEKKESHLRYRILDKNKNFRWVETYYKPIIDGMDETTSIICSTRDVTEREQLMNDLEVALEKERELNELRSRFVSTASHQFRTPLTIIQSGVEIMDMYVEGIPEENKKRFQKQFGRIKGEVFRLQDLMNDVLLLGRADAERTPYQPEKRDLVAFCKQLIDRNYNNLYPKERKVHLIVKGKKQEVYFDTKLLEHSLDNILSNAYKYSEEGNIEMTINFEYETVTISIKDEGIGIPESDLGNLFQPFYRAGNTSEIEGTGLGLSIVKEFIDKHNGQIFVISELGKGTTVNVTLPL